MTRLATGWRRRRARQPPRGARPVAVVRALPRSIGDVGFPAGLLLLVLALLLFVQGGN